MSLHHIVDFTSGFDLFPIIQIPLLLDSEIQEITSRLMGLSVLAAPTSYSTNSHSKVRKMRRQGLLEIAGIRKMYIFAAIMKHRSELLLIDDLAFIIYRTPMHNISCL